MFAIYQMTATQQGPGYVWCDDCETLEEARYLIEQTWFDFDDRSLWAIMCVRTKTFVSCGLVCHAIEPAACLA